MRKDLSSISTQRVECWARPLLGQKKLTMKESLASPMKELIFKFNEGPRRMSNSRWAHSICFSEAFIDKKNDEWIFSQIPFRSKELQRSLGF